MGQPQDASADRDDTPVSAGRLAEQSWATGGDRMAVLNFSEKLIEEKERHLRESIEKHYSRVRDVEKELGGLSTQLKINTGPKRSALLMLRKKIEQQNERVLAARGLFQAARKVAEEREAVLRAEEAVKEGLCRELSMLVQQSAHAQLAQLEHLTSRLETLNSGMQPGPGSGTGSGSSGAQGQAPAAAPAQQPLGVVYPPGAPQSPAQSPAQPPAQEPAAAGARPASGGAQAEHKAASPPSPQPAQGGRRPATPDKSPAAAGGALRAATADAARAARGRHVPLGPRRQASGPPKPEPSPPPALQARAAPGSGRFEGFNS